MLRSTYIRLSLRACGRVVGVWAGQARMSAEHVMQAHGEKPRIRAGAVLL